MHTTATVEEIMRTVGSGFAITFSLGGAADALTIEITSPRKRITQSVPKVEIDCARVDAVALAICSARNRLQAE